ncbi:MAG: hypothetical protein AAF438_08705 [Pseudomonadota bacterium]
MDKQDSGFSVELLPSSSQPITAVHLSTVAFVGRARRGPVDHPVRVESFADFTKQFGGLWLPSPMSFAVYQFFENGGIAAYIVRVSSAGHRASIELPTQGSSCLTLEALNPGGYEFLRVAIDYDNIELPYKQLFNLTIQRTSDAEGGLVLDQEIYARVSSVRGAANFVTSVLEDSKLARVRGDVPMDRPLTTSDDGGSGYRSITGSGHDGATVKDVDVLQSCYCLRGLDFPFLCLPPPSRHQDISVQVWRSALEFCRESDTILIVDPPRSWRSVDDVRHGVSTLGIRDSHGLLAFPGVETQTQGNKLSYHAPCGVVAGLLTRAGVERASWEFPKGWRVRGVKRLVSHLTDAQAKVLNELGVNCLREMNAIAKVLDGDKTLASDGVWSSLTAARFAYFLRMSVKQGTQWAVFLPNDSVLWQRLRNQVHSFLSKQFEWAVDERDLENLFYVRCDGSTNPPAEVDQGRINIEIGFALDTPGQFHRITITHNKEVEEQT